MKKSPTSQRESLRRSLCDTAQFICLICHDAAYISAFDSLVKKDA